MTDSASIPVAGSLSAKIIRACPKHTDCVLTCPERKVEDLGEIASFDMRKHPTRTWIVDQFQKFLSGGH